MKIIFGCYLVVALVSYCVASLDQDATKQHEPFLPPVDSLEAESARAIYNDYFRGGLTLTAAMARISEIDFGIGGKAEGAVNEIASDGKGERKGEQQQKPRIAKRGELYASTVVALMAEHYYFAAGLAATQGTGSSSHHQGSSVNAAAQQQQQPALLPPRKEKVLLVLSLFREARELARIGTPTHHFLSVKLFRLLLFLDRCPEALQLAERYVARAKKLNRKSGIVINATNSLGVLNLQCYLKVQSKDEKQQKMNYLNKAISHFMDVLDLDPVNAFSMITLGSACVQLHKMTGDLFPQTFDLFARGLSLDESAATWETYDDYGTTLQRFGRFEESYQVFARAVARGFIPSVYQRNTMHVPKGFISQPFWNVAEETAEMPNELPAHYRAHVNLLRASHAVFKQEFSEFVQSRKKGSGIGAMETQRELALPSGDWKQMVLWNFGQRLPGCDLLPRTCEIVSGIHESISHPHGVISYSMLTPGTHIPSHIGSTGSRLRLHLGIDVFPGSYIRVGNATKTWVEGEVLAFDDAFEHEVWNNSTRTRVVLVVDLWHPYLLKKDDSNNGHAETPSDDSQASSATASCDASVNVVRED